MTEPTAHHFAGFDGADLVWREMGGGRAVLMLHGFFSDAQTNWIKYGHADALAARGFRVIMPDLRAHGDSAKPHDVAGYPPDVLARDGLALVERLGLTDYDLVGYSLGARTALRMMIMGARPRRTVISGMGYQGVIDATRRGDFFRRVLTQIGSFERGTPEWFAEAFLKTSGGDPKALVHILDTFVSSTDAELATLDRPVLVLCGEEDQDNGSAQQLAEALPDARYQAVPGNHMSAVAKADLGEAIAAYLAA